MVRAILERIFHAIDMVAKALRRLDLALCERSINLKISIEFVRQRFFGPSLKKGRKALLIHTNTKLIRLCIRSI